MHICLTAGLNPFKPVEGSDRDKFKTTAEQIMGNANILTDDLVAMNTALFNGEIDAYFTGGTYTALLQDMMVLLMSEELLLGQVSRWKGWCSLDRINICC
ncbi:MAG: hypothetical protein CM15mP109_14910 [Candidatus Dadabacteria bacterium]|nr:MAG: hypothetical protein CM15mP109_14910 [Candidatus Dadabacteria bacterium]